MDSNITPKQYEPAYVENKSSSPEHRDVYQTEDARDVLVSGPRVSSIRAGFEQGASQSAKRDEYNEKVVRQHQPPWRSKNGSPSEKNVSSPKADEPRVWQSASSTLETKREISETPASKWNNHVSSSTERVVERHAMKSSRTEEFVMHDGASERLKALSLSADGEPGNRLIKKITTVSESQSNERMDKVRPRESYDKLRPCK